MTKKDAKKEKDTLQDAADRASSGNNTGRGEEGTGAAQTSARKNSSRRRSRNDRSSKRESGSAGNRRGMITNTLDAFQVETPVHGETLLFPADSAAAQAFGTFSSGAGQENFIAHWTHIDYGPGVTTNYTVTVSQFSRRTANAMCISFIPYFGSLDANVENTFLNPIRMAALNLKQYIDTSFGTNTNYDPADLMAYLMAVAAVWTMAAEIKRDIRLVYTYLTKQFPQFLPMGLFALLHITDGSETAYSGGEGYLYTSTYLRSLIDQLNRVLITFNRLPMPPELTIFGYNDDLFESLFADSDDLETAQLYLFRTEGYWKYNSTGSIRGSRLEYHEWPSKMSIEAKIQHMSDVVLQLTALRTSDTAMLQNLYNAYGSKDTARIGLMDINGLQGLGFVYSPDVLSMIENMNWGRVTSGEATPVIPNAAHVSDISVDSDTSNLIGHVWTNAQGHDRWPNLPIQFHKPYSEVTQNDIGWALRMHPAFIAEKTFTIVKRNDEEQTLTDVVTCDGYVGFAIPSHITVASFNNDGTFYLVDWDSRDVYSAGASGAWYESVFNDFRHCPIFISSEYNADAKTCRLQWYNAQRDVEFSYRLGDLSTYWTYLTQDVYAGNVVREVAGTRRFNAR